MTSAPSEEEMRQARRELASGELRPQVFPVSEPVLFNAAGEYNPYCGLRCAYRLGGLRGVLGVWRARRR